MAQLEIRNLSFTYPESLRPTISQISLSVEKGEYIALCGATGSGKTTLLRRLKREIAPAGVQSGEILLNGIPLEQLAPMQSAQCIGYVMQRPEQQIVTDRVWHELAFGLENMGMERQKMRRRVSEMAAYFGIEDWFEQSTDSLSGGQKQLLNLAAVMVMDPQILILDEPTAQLDPIAAVDFLATVRRLNRELGLTVIIAEHRLEDVIPECDRLAVMKNGRLICCAPPEQAAADLNGDPDLLEAMPVAVKLFNRLGGEGKCPLSVRQGRRFIEESFRCDIPCLPEKKREKPDGSPALEMKNCFFRYGRDLPDVLSGLDLRVNEGEIFFILGGNGSGKSTALSAAAGLLKCCSGQIKVFGKKLSEYKNQTLYSNCLAMLPQDVQTVFVRPTVREELADAGFFSDSQEGQLLRDILPANFGALMDMHPYDLSGGQQQLLALTRVLGANPRLLLLDEPTKGLDAALRREVGRMLHALRDRGITVVVVTHDVEFAAEYADRCALFFRGEATSEGEPVEFFSGNSFYTTAVSRMTRGYFEGAVTCAQAEELCLLNGRKQLCR